MVPEGATEGNNTLLYREEFTEDGSVTSTVSVGFIRESDDGGTYEFQLDGHVSSIHVSVLFPEDIRIAHSQVRHRYNSKGTWFESTGQEPSTFGKVASDALAPPNLPGYIPYGVGAGYNLVRKLARKEPGKMDDDAANEYDPVSLVSSPGKRFRGFSMRVPIGRLETDKKYNTKVDARYYDGFE